MIQVLIGYTFFFKKNVQKIQILVCLILSDRVFSYNTPPILVACNKHDQTFAKSCKVIQGQIEKEM
jgi:signal recognition particle receptor subunit beta